MLILWAQGVKTKHTSFSSEETDMCSKLFPLSLGQNPSSDRLRSSSILSFWCFGLLPEYNPHSLAETFVESDPAALAKAFSYSSIPTW